LLVGDPRIPLGRPRPLQVIAKGRAGGGVESSERRLPADQPVDRGRPLVAFASALRGRAGLGARGPGREWHMPVQDGQQQAHRQAEEKTVRPKSLRRRCLALHDGRE